MKNFFTDRIEQNSKKIKKDVFINIERMVQTKTLNYETIISMAKSYSKYLLDNNMQRAVAVIYMPANIDLATVFLSCLYADITPIFKTISENLSEEKFDYEFKQLLDNIDVIDLVICDKNRLNLRNKCLNNNINFCSLSNNDDDVFIKSINRKQKVTDLIIITSGTTNSCKAVTISFSNLKHCLENCKEMWDMNEDSVNLSWAPHSHVLGLITGYLLPMYVGCVSIIMSPKDFVTDPSSWLKLISKYKVTNCSTTLYGLELCNKLFDEFEIEDISLSTLKYIGIGGELIKSMVLNEFCEKYSKFGFTNKMFSPSYGMTENSGVVSSIVKSDKYISVKFDSEGLKTGVLKENNVNGNDIVSVGKIPKDTEIYIIDENNNILQDGEVGEIIISSPGLTKGYLHKDQNEMFQKIFSLTSKKYFKTGDCGGFYKNQLFITGRIKEIINIKGKKYSPYDIENCILEKITYKLKGIVIFSTYLNNEEKLICFASINHNEPNITNKIKNEIKKISKKYYNLNMYDIVFMDISDIPRTESKKIRRQMCKQIYEEKYIKEVR